MITTYDIGNILYEKVSSLGIPRYHKDAFPEEELTDERIVIIVKPQTEGKYWERCYVEINVCIPDKDGVYNRGRVGALEPIIKSLFKNSIAGSYDGTTFRYRRESIGINPDQTLKIHFINTRILFESQKVL